MLVQPNRDINYLLQICISNESVKPEFKQGSLRIVLFIKLFCYLLYFNDLILLTFTLKENLTYSVTNVDALQISILMGYEV